MVKSNSGHGTDGGITRRTYLATTTVGVGGAVGVAGCLGDDDVIEMRSNSPAARGSVHGDAGFWLAEEIEERTGGDIEIDAFANSELGGQIESIENVSTGDLAIYITPYALVGTQWADVQAFDLPYMYDEDRPFEHVHEVCDPRDAPGSAPEVFDELAERTDIRPFGTVVQGTRRVTTRENPARNPEELSEFLLRAVPITVYEEAVRGLGAETTQIDFEELPQALSTGAVDGQENPYDVFMSVGVHEHIDHVMETNHMHPPLGFIMNEDLWQEDLTEDQRDIFIETVRDLQPRGIDQLEGEVDDARDELRDMGIEIWGPEDIEFDAFESRTKQHMQDETPELVEVGEDILGESY